MSKQLHLLRRPEDERPDPLGSDILALVPEHEVRILELFDAPTHVATLDLTLSERDMPELAAVLHWADEVHVHNLAPQFVLATLPYVKPVALENTTLILRGPWVVPTRPIGKSGARLERWPGPVRMHRPPRDHGFIAPVAAVIELAPVLDRKRAALLPRACGPIPLEVEDGRKLAVVGIGADVPEDERTAMRHVLPTVGATEVALEIIDETSIPVAERDEVRRSMQAYIVPALEDSTWSRLFLEAVAQEVPIISLGDPVAGAPPDVVFTRSRDSVDRCAAVLRGWCRDWANGNAAPLNPEGRRTWLEELGVT